MLWNLEGKDFPEVGNNICEEENNFSKQNIEENSKKREITRSAQKIERKIALFSSLRGG